MKFQTHANFFSRARRPLQWCVAVYWIALFVATHLPLGEEAFPSQVSDKSLHWIAYTGLAFLLCCWREAIKRVTFRCLVQIVVLLAFYASLEELLQIPIGRHADVRDGIADMGGSGCGILLFAVVRALCGRQGHQNDAK